MEISGISTEGCGRICTKSKEMDEINGTSTGGCGRICTRFDAVVVMVYDYEK